MLLFLFVTVMYLPCLHQGILGFGSALVGVPLALLFLPKETVVSSSGKVTVALGASVLATTHQLHPPRWSTCHPSFTIPR